MRALAFKTERDVNAMPSNIYEKIWDEHIVHEKAGEDTILYVDCHLVHEVTSPQAFEGLRLAGRKTRRPDLTFATMDHNIPTIDQSGPIKDPLSRTQVETLEANCSEFDITCFGMGDVRNGIVHIIGPDLGITQPGMTIVCGDSHTATHGAFGALAFGIGTSEVEHVLATQTLRQSRSKTSTLHLQKSSRIFVRHAMPSGLASVPQQSSALQRSSVRMSMSISEPQSAMT